jgi:biopolymer transport protein ExbD
MRIQESESVDDESLNLAPMIDVVFLLLIFFMVATTFATLEERMDLELPQAESGETQVEEPRELVLDVTRDGQVFVDGNALDDLALAELLERTARRDPRTPVTVRGDRDIDYGRIVRVLDLARTAGLENAGLSTREG